jgi:hypothetical protein
MAKKLSARRIKLFEAWTNKLLSRLSIVLPVIRGCKDSRADAECVVHYPYKTITVRYDDDLVQDWLGGNEQRVVGVLTHEMCHPLTDPLYCKAVERWTAQQEIEDERERLTDHIANIILRANLV